MATVEIEVVGKDSTGGVLGNLGSIITGIESAINLMSRAWDAAVGAITPFIESAAESELTITRMEAVLRATQGAAGLTSQELQNVANELQGITRFGDETILTGATLMLTFRNIGEETMLRAIPAMLDMAEIFGSVDSAAMQLGKALNDPVNMMGALSRAGVTFTDEQKEMIKTLVESGDLLGAQNIILTELEMQVGGVAEAVGGTFTGAWEIAKNKLDEFRELIGGPIIIGLTALLEKVGEFVDTNPAIQAFVYFFEQLNDLMQKGSPFANSVAIALSNLTLKFPELSAAVDPFIGVFVNMQRALDDGLPLIMAIANAFNDLSVVLDGTVFGNIARIIGDFINTGITEGWGEAFRQGVTDMWQLVAPAIEQFFVNVFTAMENRIQLWISGGGPDRLSNAIAASLSVTFASPEFQNVAGQALASLTNAIMRAIASVDWFAAFAPFEEQANQALRDALDGVVQAIYDWFRTGEITQAWERIWRDVTYGMQLGLSFENIKFNIQNFVNNVVNYFKQLLGIASPSQVFLQIGKDIVQGLINGITSMFGGLTTAVGNMFDILTGGSGGTGGASATTSFGSTGTIGGRPMGGTGTGTGGVLTGGRVTNNFYAPVYFGDLSSIGYDCPSPHPLIAATAGQIGGR
jgi:hypothetical protein